MKMQKSFILCIVCMLTLSFLMAGCGKQARVDVKAEYERLYYNASEAYEAAVTQEEMERVYQGLIDSMYVLLSDNMGAAYTDTMFAQAYHQFTYEQRKALFEKMPKSFLQQEEIARLHNSFEQEAMTLPGNPYVDFTGFTPDGEELSLHELVGKTDYVLVDFWASWCGPCRRLIPVLKDIYAAQPQGRLQILSCSVDKGESAWRTALKEEEMAWPQIREDADHSCSDKYAVMYIPHTVLIDREGKIVAVNPEEPELEQILFGE